MKVLVACEFSGAVKSQFMLRGHDAWSCDLLPARDPFTKNHIQGDVLDIIGDGWDLMIAHPPCTHLAVSGARWFHKKQTEQQAALNFVHALLGAPIHKIALENPVSIISSRIRKPDQIIQPWQFGHPETKKTCLWLKNLPKLKPTNDVYAEMMQLPKKQRHRIWYASPGLKRGEERSITYRGIAVAMAEQWGT